MPPHLLSLPVETIENAVGFLVHPVDAFNLSRACKYFRTLLRTHCNSIWYNFLKSYEFQKRYRDWCERARICHLAHFFSGARTYDPNEDYYKAVRTAYFMSDTCRLCFAYTDRNVKAWLGKMGVDAKSLRALGVKSLCASCFVEHTVAAWEFLPFELDIKTNPPKSVYCLEPGPSGPKGGKRFYWRPDIDNLCIVQKGFPLSVLQNTYPDEMALMELDEKSRLHWKSRCKNAIKAALTDKAWEIWSGDAKYEYARATFATDMSKKKLQQWLGLTARYFQTSPPRFLEVLFAKTTTKVGFARMDQAWIEGIAADLLIDLRCQREYLRRCVFWHYKRIMAELERTQMRDVADLCDRCNICYNRLRSPGVAGYLDHMQYSHEEFWEDGSWMIV